jgi:uncharacterized protein YqgQ
MSIGEFNEQEYMKMTGAQVMSRARYLHNRVIVAEQRRRDLEKEILRLKGFTPMVAG